MTNTITKELSIIESVAKRVTNLGGRVFFVGGYVRDAIIGKPNKDIDVEVHGVTPVQLTLILESLGFVVDTVGASFGVLMAKGVDIDFTFPRTENKTGSKHTDFEVAIDTTLSPEEAARRRDFTMNAIMKDVLTGEIIDPFNGLSDIEKGLICFVDAKTYREDELRALRAAQFAARFDFEISKETLKNSEAFTFNQLAGERVLEELKKALMKAEKPSRFFAALHSMKALSKLFPELHALIGVGQDAVHHPEGDAFTHTMMVVDEAAKLRHLASNPVAFMLSAVTHDFGKTVTTEVTSTGRITAHGHGQAGVPFATSFIKRLTNETNVVDYVLNMTHNHMKAHLLLEMSDKAVRTLMTETNMADLMLFGEADERGRAVSFVDRRVEGHARITELSNGSFGEVVPHIKGRDLIEMGLATGPMIGLLLAEAFSKQLAGRSHSEITSHMSRRVANLIQGQ